MLGKTKFAALLLSACAANAAFAGSGSGTVGLSINLVPACAISSGGSDNFGTLDFGQVKPFWTAALSASTQAMVSLVCSDGVSTVSVSIDGGLRGDRTLQASGCAGDPTCDTIPYRVFRNPGRTVEYVIDEAQNFSVPTTTTGEEVTLQIPLYGSISPGTATRFDTYTDTLRVTIDFN